MMAQWHSLSTRVIVRVLLLQLLLLPHAYGWRQWTWDASDDSPGARRGHSMCVYKSQLIVFGGRTEDTTATHIPKTYEIHKVNGSLEFLSYEDKVARPTDPTDVRVAVHLNDVWSYDINCTRYADESCRDSTWRVLNAGEVNGGCTNVFGAHVCSHPTERWLHRAEVFEADNSMIVFGGFSRFCDDYCNDMWLFDFIDQSWTEMMEIGNTAPGPGKRFRAASVMAGDRMYVFGGFRMWHGFAHENSVENDWEGTSQYPLGGYLNDLWVYDKAHNAWTNVTTTLACPDLTLLDTTLNMDTSCSMPAWPPGRAGHAAVFHDNALFIHGGYRTFFPYPSTTGRGAGRGTLADRSAGFIPYPTHPYYLEDFWKFNLTTQRWTQIQATATDATLSSVDVDRRLQKTPPPRTDHTLVAASNGVFVLFGGYISNHYYDDTWQFNTSASRWVQQKTFVHALYPPSCTDDLAARRLEHSGDYAAFVPPVELQAPLDDDGYVFSKERHYGTLECSVFAEPTRFASAAAAPAVFVAQARRQAPGWDGCRDRNDGRTDLPQELQYAHPSQRSGHTTAYHAAFDKVFVFGGYGFSRASAYQVETTFAATSLGDLWQYDLHNCPKNCSRHGACHAGNCRCNDGYYGSDCSNTTCPGSYCRYDDVEQTQRCTHCCFSGFEHTPNNDSFVENIVKLPCSDTNVHYSNGVCDGFGKCICKPPFIGDDCSIRDCRYNCSGHGYCSVEFPNSRCMCDDGWFGQYCDAQMCLNNCSYPNGACVNGSCYCAMVYEPYNRTLEYLPLMGVDCSFLVPFARAASSARISVLAISVAAFVALWIVA